MTKRYYVAFVVCLLIPLLVGALAGAITSYDVATWYATLHKPSFNPPNWLFGPVWTALYVLMGISLFLIWRSPKSRSRSLSILLFAVQLALNFVWTIVFFMLHKLQFAVLEIILLWFAVAAMIRMYARISRVAAALQVPYMLWITFASILTVFVWALN